MGDGTGIFYFIKTRHTFFDEKSLWDSVDIVRKIIFFNQRFLLC